MSVWGKVLGAGAGFALGGPLGALVGAAAGHYIAKFRADALSAEGAENISFSGASSREARLSTLAPLAKGVVEQNKRHHRLDNRNRSRHHAGIMTTPGLNGGGLTRRVDRGLLSEDGRHGLESDPERHRHAIRDPTLDATGVIGGGDHLTDTRSRHKDIIVG